MYNSHGQIAQKLAFSCIASFLVMIYLFVCLSAAKRLLAECVCCECRQLKSHHAMVLINLCVALIIANVVFLAGANQVNNQVSRSPVTIHIIFLECIRAHISRFQRCADRQTDAAFQHQRQQSNASSQRWFSRCRRQ